MTLTTLDIKQLANSAYLKLTDLQINEYLEKLNSIFILIEQIKTINTTNIPSLNYPVITLDENFSLFLRDDIVTKTDYDLIYPQLILNTQDHLYLVPKVIE